MEPTKFKEASMVLQCPEGGLNDNFDCNELPVYVKGNLIISHWKLSKEEVKQICEEAILWLWVHSDKIAPTVMVNPLSPFVEQKPKLLGVKQTPAPPAKVPPTSTEAVYRLDGYTIYKIRFSGRALKKIRIESGLWVAVVSSFYPPISLDLAYPFNLPEEEIQEHKIKIDSER